LRTANFEGEVSLTIFDVFCIKFYSKKIKRTCGTCFFFLESCGTC